MLDAVIVSPASPMAGISRPMVVVGRRADPARAAGGQRQPGARGRRHGAAPRRARESIGVTLRLNAGRVVRLDVDRFQRRNQVKLSLLDLPFLPEDVRDLAPGPKPPLERT